MPDEKQMQEIRDRLIAVERDQVNLEKTFTTFRQDTWNEFKELKDKLDNIGVKVDQITAAQAKWLGGLSVVVVLVQIAAKYIL